MKASIIAMFILAIVSEHLGWHKWNYFESIVVFLLGMIAWKLSEI